MSTFALLSLLVSTGALFSFLSIRVLRLPTSVGTMILSLAAAAALIVGGQRAPWLHAGAARLVAGIDFNQVVLHGMLAILLFAGALQLDFSQLTREKIPVLSLSVGATAISTLLVAGLLKLALLAVHIQLSTMSALLFGALISPTDPIAVLEMLQRAGAPPQLRVQLAGESLFNDGVGAVLFLALLSASSSGSLPSVKDFTLLLLLQAGGGIALGFALGYFVYRVILLVDSYRVEVLLTLALAMGGYALADALHLSAPLEVVTAGLLVGGRVRKFAMSRATRDNLDRFWELLDDMMNVVLFLLLGLELLVLPIREVFLLAGLIAIPIVLLSRLASVSVTVAVLALFRQRMPGSILVLTWGGLRGALAVALALSLPGGPGQQRNLLLATTYIVVVFSILVQGLTIAPFLRRHAA